MIRALSIIFGCLALGEVGVSVTGIQLPGSIIGMGLLFAALQAGKSIVVSTVSGCAHE